MDQLPEVLPEAPPIVALPEAPPVVVPPQAPPVIVPPEAPPVAAMSGAPPVVVPPEAPPVAVVSEAPPIAAPPVPPPVVTTEPPPPPADESWVQWFREDGYWFITSALVHAIGFVIFALLAPLVPVGWFGSAGSWFSAPTFDGAEVYTGPDMEIDHFEVGDPQVEPSELTTETLKIVTPPGSPRDYDNSDVFKEEGGGMPMAITGPNLGGLGGFRLQGPGVGGPGGVGVGVGTGVNPGSGGSGTGFGGRGQGHGRGGGPTKAGDRAVAAALNWLNRHRSPAGNWSLQFNKHCGSSHGCGGQGSVQSDAAATSMALLCFFAAGQTHKEKGPYQKAISGGVSWLIKHQREDGNLSAGARQPMYSHGLATIALCEAYGMTHDEHVGRAAAKGLRFIEMAQNPVTGGWRYQPGDPGDTSVLGWEVMALKSGQMAGLGVNTMVLENSRKWLDSVARGDYRGLFCYQPYKEPTPPMTAVGMLCHQYLGDVPDSPSMLEGKRYLLTHPPSSATDRDTYYWYYATLAMHNFLDKDWDTWNRQMRRNLVESQCRLPGRCDEGSWDPERPTQDKWGGQGGRLMTTCLSTLTLEVYYRYLPLFKGGERIEAPGPNKTTVATGH